jgi:hypothetical protein
MTGKQIKDMCKKTDCKKCQAYINDCGCIFSNRAPANWTTEQMIAMNKLIKKKLKERTP